VIPERSDELLGTARVAGVDAMARLVAEIEQGRLAESRAAPSDEEIVAWSEREIGVKLRTVPKILGILLYVLKHFRERKILRLVILGPRGGGKTYLAALIEMIAYRFFGYDWSNIGASGEQAARCYAHIRDAHLTSSDLANFTLYCQAETTKAKAGGSITIHTASEKSIRGAHPGGPSGGGGLTLDEAALIEDRLIDASKGQLTSADPSALLQLSTMGERQVGRFWQLIQSPSMAGYDLRRFNIFDVAKRCPYDCKTTCPVKEHFAEHYYEGDGPTRRIVHEAYCAGKAHEVDGWVSIDEIAQQFIDQSREVFERELMGKAVAAAGHIYDPITIDESILRSKALAKDPKDHARRFQLLEKAVGLDWGFAGECAIVYVVRMSDALVAYRWEFFTRERFGPIREHILERCFDEHIESIFADSANPSDNEELHNLGQQVADKRGIDWSPRVVPVVFSKWKAYGIGEVRRRFEKKLLRLAPDLGGGPKDPLFDRAVRYLKAYHADDTGKPVKVDDHGPDALLCAVIGFSLSFRGMADPTAIHKRA
jgi:hypothetical protein